MSILNDLNTVQRKAASVLDGPVMIVAGAGSGKTRVLTYRVAHLIEMNIKPYEILALTFTNKAANEMKERIARLVGPQAVNIWAGTFHSIFARILRKECEAIGFQRSFSIYDTTDSLSLVKSLMSRMNISTQQTNPRAVQSRISSAKNAMVSPNEYETIARDIFEQTVAKIFHEYQSQLLKNNAMDFDDLLLRPIELFQRHPAVLERYQYRFKYILVDEYQDTNHAQYELIKMLADRFKNICVVGDDAQSIYAFRGADIRNILDFERDYAHCKVFRLEQNYRSTKRILAAADSVIKHNRRQIHKNLWTENADGDPLTLIETEDDKDEGVQIARRIEEFCAHQKMDIKDFAVLYRTNAQSRSLEDALRRSGIPYVIVGGVEFYERKEIKDVLAYLRVVVNPNDEESLLRIINYPVRGIGDTTVEKLISHARHANLTLFDALKNIDSLHSLSERMKKNISQCASFIIKYRDLRIQMSASELARAMVDELGILRMYKEEQTAEALARWENIQELLSAITEFADTKEEPSLEAFLEEVALISPVDTMVDTQNAVTLMTLHSAKGLEYPVVFITGMEEGLFPLYQVTMEAQELEEERRLFYVGVTRAMKKVFLTHTRLRYRFGDISYPVLSRFVEEIDQTLLVKESSKQYRTASVAAISQLAGSAHRRRKAPATSYDAESHFSDHRSSSVDDESQEHRTLEVGVYVEHETFGKGKILQISGRGEDTKAVVNFSTVGRKNLMIKYAKLRILNL